MYNVKIEKKKKKKGRAEKGGGVIIQETFSHEFACMTLGKTIPALCPFIMSHLVGWSFA